MERALSGIAQRQFGVISRQQAVAMGATRSAIAWQLREGNWSQVFRGVYRVSGTPPTWMQQAFATLLFAGPDAALSHRTAGYLHRLDGLSDRAPTPIDVSVPLTHHAGIPGLALHRMSRSIFAVRIRGLRVTGLAKTLVDLSGVLAEPQLEMALDSAHRRFPRLAEWLQRHFDAEGPRCGPVATLRKLLAARLGDRATDSPLEVDVRRALRGSGLARSKAGLEVFDEQGYVMRVDFAWPEHLVALHVDSYLWHNQRIRFERDAMQRTRLAALGWLSLIVTRQAMSEPGWLRALEQTLNDRAPQRRLALQPSRSPRWPPGQWERDRADPR